MRRRTQRTIEPVLTPLTVAPPLQLARSVRTNSIVRSVRDRTKVVPLMLSELLSKALKDGLIVPEKLPSFEWVKHKREWFAKFYGHPHTSITAEDWFNFVKSHLPDSRNYLAHGNTKLWWTESFSQVELCGDIINALFANCKTQ